jgi:hypothetical protein
MGMGSWAALCTLLWLNLETAATLELTPEDERHPIEAALSSRGRQGWRASGLDRRPSVFVFDQPQRVRRINLVFNEAETGRTHEFVLRWRSEADQGFRKILRQQWNFSPPQTHAKLKTIRLTSQA